MTEMRISTFARRAAAVAAFTVLPGLALHAQQAGLPTEAPASASPALVSFSTPAPAFHFTDGTGSSTSTSSTSSNDTSSSSSSSVETERLNLMGDGLQPPPRRSYGRPRYNDNSHNPDGSSKYTFEAAIGFTQPLGNTYHYLTPSYSFQFGGGRNFSKKFATLIQFDWDNFGFNGRTLTNQGVIEDPTNYTGEIQGQLNGTSHVWSFTLDPKYNVIDGDKLGLYVVGGGGFYHKTANFFVTVPEVVYIYGFPEEYAANATIDKYTSNAPGVDGGFGVTYKPSKFANERIFAEIRYDLVFNQHKAGANPSNYLTYFNPVTLTYSTNNLYPANSNRTTYLPIKFGIRF